MSEGIEKLKKAVNEDCQKYGGTLHEEGCIKCGAKCFNEYCDKYKQVIDDAKEMGEIVGQKPEDLIDAWESHRNYGYLNYYPQGITKATKRYKVFDTVDDLWKSVGTSGFRCPRCGGVSTDPYKCNSGKKMNKKEVCNWKVYGLFGDLGKGIYVYVKDMFAGEQIFMPLAWEDEYKEEEAKE